MTFTAEQKAELAKPLSSAHVKPPKKFGPKGDYIEGWHAIAEANRIFGFDGWSYTVELSRDDVSLGKDRDGNDQWQAAYTCICTVTAGGVTRQDVGFGSGFAKMIGDAIEGATKEATTDALKRCLRTFGNPFGLALYDKERANVADALPDSVERMVSGLRDAATNGEVAMAAYWKAHWPAVPQEHRAHVLAIKEELKAGMALVDNVRAG